MRNVHFRYGRDGFSMAIEHLDIEAGKHVALTGPSGSGKTTFLSLLAGIVTPLRGDVTVERTNVTRLTDAQRRRFRLHHVGMVFQEFELLEYLTVAENILLPCWIGSPAAQAESPRSRLERLAEQVGIADKLRRNVGSLSQGERQRVALCRALLPGPRLLLADEPTGNLDPALKQQAMETLQTAARQVNATLLVVTHDHSLLKTFDNVLSIDDIATRGSS